VRGAGVGLRSVQERRRVGRRLQITPGRRRHERHGAPAVITGSNPWTDSVSIADDHPVFETVCGPCWRRINVEVVGRRKREEAVAWQRSPADLVMMDVQMPGINGIKATRQIALLS
jgi:hypothetical protein